MESTRFKIVLHSPVIPGNTGTIGRTCLALGLELILVGKLGFSLSDKEVRRAGLDYWKYVSIKKYPDWGTFLKEEQPTSDSMFFFSTKAKPPYYNTPYSKNCYLVFGSETKGLPQEIFDTYPNNFYTMPMFSDKIRSLNLANSATAVAYEALRQIEFNS